MSKVTTFAKTGMVVTGFSHFVVATYAESAGVVTYSNGRVASGAVDVQLSPEAFEDKKYYTDNAESESAGGKFKSGTVSFTVKGLEPTAEAMMYGLPAADQDGWTAYGDDQSVPYLASGYIERYQSEGDEYFRPVILTKTKYKPLEGSAKTQEEEIDFQSQKLNADVFRDDSSNHNWKFIGDVWTTEAEAITQINTKLSVSA